MNGTVSISDLLPKAVEYLNQGTRHGHEQLLLLAFLTLTRKPKVTPVLRTLTYHTLDATAAILTRCTSVPDRSRLCHVGGSVQDTEPVPVGRLEI